MVIIDASIAVKWVVPEESSDAATALLGRRLAAPAVWLAEAANALWSKQARHEITPNQARDRVRELATAPVTAIPLSDLLSAAMDVAIELNHPIYDCFYLAAAQLYDTQIVTADRRFANKVAGRPALGPRVSLLGRYPDRST